MRSAAQAAFEAASNSSLSYKPPKIEMKGTEPNSMTFSMISATNSIGFPTSLEPTDTEKELVNYYDEYPISSFFYSPSSFHALNQTPKGLLTLTAKYMPDTWPHFKPYHLDIFFYDSLNRLIQTHHTHQKSPMHISHLIRKDYAYNFANELTKEYIEYILPDHFTYTRSHHHYDHAGRRIQTDFGLWKAPTAPGTPTPLIRYAYDEIGRLKQKIFYPEGDAGGNVPDYIIRPPNPTNNSNDFARKAVILEPGTVIDASSLQTYRAEVDTTSSSGLTGLQTMDYSWHIRGGLRGINLDGSGNPVPDQRNYSPFFRPKVKQI